MPNAIATLLEMGRGRDEERLNADLQQIANEYAEIVATQDQLQKLKNAEPVFNAKLMWCDLAAPFHKSGLLPKSIKLSW